MTRRAAGAALQVVLLIGIAFCVSRVLGLIADVLLNGTDELP